MDGRTLSDARTLRCLAWVLLAVTLGRATAAAPLRTPSPGTGVYHGFSLDLVGIAGEERGRGAGAPDLRSSELTLRARYTPATSWSLSVLVPRVQRMARSGRGDATHRVRRSGLGDVSLVAQHRFYRRLGRWRDRQAAVAMGAVLPTGESAPGVSAAALPLPLQHALTPGSGAAGAFVDVSFQQAHGRFVQAAAIGHRANGSGSGYRFGDVTHIDLDLEAIVLPVRYEVPGHELFALLEASLVQRQPDTYRGAKVRGTRSAELLVAPGLEYVATEQLALGASAALPVLSRTEAGGRHTRWNLLLTARYAF